MFTVCDTYNISLLQYHISTNLLSYINARVSHPHPISPKTAYYIPNLSYTKHVNINKNIVDGRQRDEENINFNNKKFESR